MLACTTAVYHNWCHPQLAPLANHLLRARLHGLTHWGEKSSACHDMMTQLSPAPCSFVKQWDGRYDHSARHQ